MLEYSRPCLFSSLSTLSSNVVSPSFMTVNTTYILKTPKSVPSILIFSLKIQTQVFSCFLSISDLTNPKEISWFASRSAIHTSLNGTHMYGLACNQSLRSKSFRFLITYIQASTSTTYISRIQATSGYLHQHPNPCPYLPSPTFRQPPLLISLPSLLSLCDSSSAAQPDTVPPRLSVITVTLLKSLR